MKTTLLELDYPSNLQLYYQNLYNLPGFVLLESTDHVLGRYDILSAYPYDRIIINERTPNIMDVLKELKQKLPISSSNHDLPFQGGAIGYISYDLGARLYNIHSSAQSTLSQMPLLEFGLYDWAIITDHYLKKVTLFAANQHSSTHTLVPELLALWKKAPDNTHYFKVKHDFYPLISQESYKHSFNQIYKELCAGRSYQVNLTQPFHASYEGDPWMIYKQVSSTNPVPFSGFLRTELADILSFSPERFLSHKNGILVTSPIKGTIHRSNVRKKDEQLKNQLLLSSKNHAENIMIVDLLRNDLSKIAKPGTVEVLNLCQIQSFKSVHHLVSDIQAESIDDIHPFDLFISCFPGGSITGAPKLEAMKIINEQEPFARGVYCGSLAYFSHHGDFDSNIAIRTITAKEHILHLAAGGGIVIDSNWEAEYRECHTKISAIINGLKES